MNAINLAEKLSTFSEYWQPRVVGSFNGLDLMVVKVKGEFVWHKHDDADDFFLVHEAHVLLH
jgi:mannose-6-phosphate isomerase-like protein (cupin superfamily)